MRKNSIRDLIPLQEAFRVAHQSICLKRKVGAVLVSRGDIVSREFNRYTVPHVPCSEDSPCYSGCEERHLELERDYQERKPLAPEIRALLSVRDSKISTKGATLWTREELTSKSSMELIAASIETVRVFGKCPVWRRNEHSDEVKKLENAGVRVIQQDYLDSFWYESLPWQGQSETGETIFSSLLVSPGGEVIGQAQKQARDTFKGYFGNIGSCDNVCAERMAIYDCLRKDPSLLVGSSLYSTYEPCYFCALVIVETGIARLVFSVSASDKHLGIALLREKGVQVERIDNGDSTQRNWYSSISAEKNPPKRIGRKNPIAGTLSD